MSKRKANSDINGRSTKKQKPDAANLTEQSFKDFFSVPIDCIREIMRRIEDVDIVRSLRTSKQWKELATSEINSRFANKYFTRLKAMNAPLPSLSATEITDTINHVDRQVALAKKEIAAMNEQLTKLGEMRLKVQAKSLSIKEQFELWSDPKVPKKTFRHVRECYMQPEGEEDVWDIIEFDRPYGTVHTFDGVLDYINQYLWDRTDENEEETEARLEKYMKVMMDINFGKLVRD